MELSVELELKEFGRQPDNARQNGVQDKYYYFYYYCNSLFVVLEKSEIIPFQFSDS